MAKLIRIVISVLLLAGCTSVDAMRDQGSGAIGGQSVDDPPIRNEMLNSTLWTQTAVEYAGVTEGAYALAVLRLKEALADPGWTASLEQLGAGSYADLPPAVVLDLDETVLDNVAFQARLIEDDRPYSSALWDSWVFEAQAGAVPGALEFIRYAVAMGVQVIYLTNREAKHEEATRTNLSALGFPLDPNEDTVISRAERPEWAMSDKTSRRKFVAGRYRILLMIGDNFGDFSESVSDSIEGRARSARLYASYWGRKWIVLPNPMYGSWEAALYDFEYGDTEYQKIKKKYSHLNTLR